MKKNKLINMTTKWFDVIQLDGWLYVVDKQAPIEAMKDKVVNEGARLNAYPLTNIK